MTRLRPAAKAVLRVAMVTAPVAFALTWGLRATSGWWLYAIGLTALEVLAVMLEGAVGVLAGFVGAASLCAADAGSGRVAAAAGAGGLLGWALYPGVALALTAAPADVLRALYTDLPLCTACAAAGGLLAARAAARQAGA
ncbi:hypothetical protein BX265_6886 [Streptomyces sp. TLI_235]|nr:hypothetical protein [Streptomyces sp. TLI_235]PBC69557.1 hypothetical protein BX265_6886 [Streptomyces sp. TLI_235]